MEKKFPLTKEKFKYIYSRVPRLCVEIVINTPKGILLTLRDIEPCKNLWHIPGGTVYCRETIKDAIGRVAREELSIEVNIVRLAGYAEYPSEEKFRGWGWPIAFQFICKIKSGKPRVNEQARDMHFFKKFKDIPENTIEEHKKILRKLLEI